MELDRRGTATRALHSNPKQKSPRKRRLGGAGAKVGAGRVGGRVARSSSSGEPEMESYGCPRQQRRSLPFELVEGGGDKRAARVEADAQKKEMGVNRMEAGRDGDDDREVVREETTEVVGL